MQKHIIVKISDSSLSRSLPKTIDFIIYYYKINTKTN